jgi:hypothetical protein
MNRRDRKEGNMEKEIWAAIIQAVPSAGAIVVAFLGLNTWRRQLREGRLVEHAERALATAHPMFHAIRAARSNFSLPTDWQAGFDPSVKGVPDHQRILIWLERARDAWQNFQPHYRTARLFTKPQQHNVADEEFDVADAIGNCIFDLQVHAYIIWTCNNNPVAYTAESISPEKATADKLKKSESIFYDKSWMSTRDNPTPDPIEAQLRKAEEALREQFRPILVPKGRRKDPS